VTDSHDNPVDLTPIREDAATRASRVGARVTDRVAAARRAEAELWESVRGQLARFAIPAALAAAARLPADLLSDATSRARQLEPLAPAVLAGSPAVGWIAMDRRPDISEVLAMLRGGR
jgi:hypothetical protein